MATTGSSSSVSSPEVEPSATGVVIGIPTSVQWSATGLAEAWRGSDSRSRRAAGIIVARGEGTRTQRSAPSAEPFAGIVEQVFGLQPSDALQMPYHGLPGRARAIRAIFSRALDDGAAGCVIVDPRTTELGEWIGGFVEPLLDHDVHFVSPVYGRHPFASGLVHGILAPAFSAFYGVRVRYPFAPHFACSARLIAGVLQDPFWDTEAAQIGVEEWLLAGALDAGLDVAQATVPSRTHEHRPDADLSTTIAQVVGVLFTELERRARVWQRFRGLRAVPTFGPPLPAPDPVAVDAEGMLDTFRQAHRDLEDLWSEVLPPLGILQWRRLASAPPHAFRVADSLWARTLYDFAMSHRLRRIARDHLLRSLTPLYLAWLGSLVLELQDASVDVFDDRLARLSAAFATEKPYLVSQWRWPERFRPVKMRR